MGDCAGQWYVRSNLVWCKFDWNCLRANHLCSATVFGGTALSTYGGFWISLGIILTPGGFRIEHAYGIPDFYTGTNVLLKSCPELGLFADMSSSFRLLYFCLDDYYHHLLALHVALYVVFHYSVW